jgi:uncharacterized RDD family membrane protein YckC
METMTVARGGKYTIRTPENVELTFQLAGIGDRILAHVIDLWLTTSLTSTLFLLLFIVFLAAIKVGGLASDLFDTAGLWIFGLTLLLGTLLNLVYYFYFETRWQGQTPGKRWSGLRVLKTNGQPLDVQGALIRNVVRLIDQTLVLGLLVMVLNPREQRLGDMAAGTLVIKEIARTISPKAAVNAPVVLLNVSRLQPQDYLYLQEFLERREGLDPVAREQLAQRMAQRYLNLLGEPNLPTNTDAEGFIELLHASYAQ